MSRLAPLFALALTAVLLIPAAYSAADSPAAITKYRQAEMGAAGRHMKATSMVVKGEVSRTDDLAGHAAALAEVAKGFCTLFPEGTGPGNDFETEAKAEIWSQADDFATACKTFEDETAKLAEIAKTDDFEAFKKQFGNVGQACGDCHDVFRVEDDH